MSIPKAPAPGAAAAATAAATAPNQISAIATNPAWRDLSLYEYGINREINNSKDYPRLYFTPYDLNPANVYGKSSLTSAQIPPTYLSSRAEVGNELLVLDKLNREKTILESQEPRDQHAILINISRLHATNVRLEKQTIAMLEAYKDEQKKQTSTIGATVEQQLIKLNQFSKSFTAHFNGEVETRIKLLNKSAELNITQSNGSSPSSNTLSNKVSEEIDILKKTIEANQKKKKTEQTVYTKKLSEAKTNYEKIINESIVQINKAVTVKQLKELDKKIERVVHDYPHLEGTATQDGLARNQLMYLAETAHADQMLTLFAKNAPGRNINFPKLLADRELHHQNLTQTISRLNNLPNYQLTPIPHPKVTPLPPKNQQEIMNYFESKIEEEINAVARARDISQVSGKKTEKSIKELFSHIDQMAHLLDPIYKAQIDELKNTLRLSALNTKYKLIPGGSSIHTQRSRTEQKIEVVKKELTSNVADVLNIHKSNINKMTALAIAKVDDPNALTTAIAEIKSLAETRPTWLKSTQQLNLIDAQAEVKLEVQQSNYHQQASRAIQATTISSSPSPAPKAAPESESLKAAREKLTKLEQKFAPDVIAQDERKIADEAKVEKTRVGMVVVEEDGWTHTRAIFSAINALPAQPASVSYGTDSGAQFIGLAKGESHFYKSSLPQAAPQTAKITVTLQQSADGSHVTDLTAAQEKQTLSPDSKDQVAMMQAKLILANYKKGQGWDRIVIREPDTQMSEKIHAALLLLIDHSPAKGIEIVNKNRNAKNPDLSEGFLASTKKSNFINQHLSSTMRTTGIAQQKEMKVMLGEIKKQVSHKTEKGCLKEDDPNYFRNLKKDGPSNG